MNRNDIRRIRRIARDVIESQAPDYDNSMKLAEGAFHLVGYIYRMQKQLRDLEDIVAYQNQTHVNQRHIIKYQADVLIKQADLIRDHSMLQ